eukprot:gene13384-15743_t
MALSIIEKAVWVWSAAVLLATVGYFNVIPLLEELPWFHITIGCNTFIFSLELYLDVRQSFTIRQYKNPNVNWTDAKYHIENILGLLNFSRTESTIGFIIECAILYFGVLLHLHRLGGYWIGHYVGLGEEFFLTRGIFYLLLVSLFSSIIRLPFELYRIFLVDRPQEEGWFKQVVIDQIKMFLVSLLIGVPLLSMTLALFSWQFQYQWFLALFFSDMYPSLAFLFNDFSVLEDGELRSEIITLSKDLGFPLKEIYTMDGSKRVSHSNAFLMGFWSSSFVLYDNLVKQLSTQEILSIIGHEVGHHKFKRMYYEI